MNTRIWQDEFARRNKQEHELRKIKKMVKESWTKGELERKRERVNEDYFEFLNS